MNAPTATAAVESQDTDVLTIVDFADSSSGGYLRIGEPGPEGGEVVLKALKIEELLDETSRHLYRLMLQMDRLADGREGGEIRSALEGLLDAAFQAGREHQQSLTQTATENIG